MAAALTKQKGSSKQMKILEELKSFPVTDRIAIVEDVLETIRKDIRQEERPLNRAEKKNKLAAAAEALLPDYAGGGELTAFTALDGEDFYA